MSKRFVRLADLQYSLKFISYFVADNAKFHYDQFIKKEMVNDKDQFLLFDLTKQQDDAFKELQSIRKLIFILKHGQSFTERGFSVNKKIADVNLQEDAIISQRLVYDHLKQSEIEVWQFPITPELRKNCKLAYEKKKARQSEKKGSPS